MEGKKSMQLLRYEDLFESLERYRTRYFSEMGKRLSCFLILDKLRVAIEEVEYYIAKGREELLMDIASDFSYLDISNDSRWKTSKEKTYLVVPNKERSSYKVLGDNVVNAEYIKTVINSFDFNDKLLLASDTINDDKLSEALEGIGSRSIISDIMLEYMIDKSIFALRNKMRELDNILNKPTDELCVSLFNSTFNNIYASKYKAEVNNNFNDWKSLHLKRGTKAEKLSRLDDYLVECMVNLFKTDVLDKVVRIKSRTELKKYKNDIDFDGLDVGDIDCNAKYLLLVELIDCKHREKECIPIYEPNKENIGRFLYNNRHTLSKESREEFIRFILMLNRIQDERSLPKAETKELNYKTVVINMNNNYFKACKNILTGDYNLNWLDKFITALMNSEYKDEIAKSWASAPEKTACHIIGALKDNNILKGTYASIAKHIYGDKKNDTKVNTYSNYIGQGKKQNYADWVSCYISGK